MMWERTEVAEGSKEPGVGGSDGRVLHLGGGTNHQRPPDLVNQLGIMERKWKSLEQLPMGSPCGLAGKESTCNAGDLGSISGSGRSRGEGNSYPLQYSHLENSMDCIVHRVAKSCT